MHDVTHTYDFKLLFIDLMNGCATEFAIEDYKKEIILCGRSFNDVAIKTSIVY